MPTLTLPARFQAEPFNGDYYKIFGVPRNPSPTSKQIKDAYHKMSLLYHPFVLQRLLSFSPARGRD